MTPPATHAAAFPATRPSRPAAPRRTPRRGVHAPPRGGVRATPAQKTRARSSHRLDRLIRGRALIGLIAFALIGIVAMQLWVLKLNSGIGRALQHTAYLERSNAALEIADSRAAAGDR
ncbi:MAG TPA: hypothetical protein VGX16_00365, partial [Solirubrobacteraceae bacterium]|nr:hypothetical protein [Solirubrobacteraceae bacterium]